MARDGKWKDCFMKLDMVRNDDGTGGRIEAAIGLMVVGVSEENTRMGPRGEFVWCLRAQPWEAPASEYPESMVVRRSTEKSLKGRHIVKLTRW